LNKEKFDMNIVIFICTLVGSIGAIYGILAYRNEYIQKPKEHIFALTTQFLANQKLATEILHQLVTYADTNKAYNEPFFQGVSFSKYIELMTNTLNHDLADATLEKVIKGTDSIIKSMAGSLDEQCKNLLQVKNYFQLYFHQSKLT
jgi:hypothetical protein